MKEYYLILNATTSDGLNLAEAYAKKGENLVLVDSNGEALKKISDKLKADYGIAIHEIPQACHSRSEKRNIHLELIFEDIYLKNKENPLLEKLTSLKAQRLYA